MPRCYLIIGEVGAGEGGEGAAGRPGQDVLTLQGRVDAGLGEDGEDAPGAAPALQLGGVGEAELVDRAHGGHQHHHAAPALVDADPRQQRRVHKPLMW